MIIIIIIIVTNSIHTSSNSSSNDSICTIIRFKTLGFYKNLFSSLI